MISWQEKEISKDIKYKVANFNGMPTAGHSYGKAIFPQKFLLCQTKHYEFEFKRKKWKSIKKTSICSEKKKNRKNYKLGSEKIVAGSE